MNIPIFAKFGQSIGLFYNHNKDKIILQLINYPSCKDNPLTPILIPKYFSKEIDLYNYVYLINPYPSSQANSKINIRFNKLLNITIKDLKTLKLITDGEINKNTYFKITPFSYSDVHIIEYNAIIEGYLGELISGKTCKLYFKTPKCL